MKLDPEQYGPSPISASFEAWILRQVLLQFTFDVMARSVPPFSSETSTPQESQ